MLKKDPIENSPEYKAVIDDVERELDEMLKDNPLYGCRGFCHVYWPAKRQLLKEKYGIDWRTPQQMNPRVKFD